ncbi:MAG: T9SS type A sorting domain-containing protein, partial [Bacteroidales bacterium]|nr:T9SS type A sorting domain-containing protein [Bacteroidales bacterium]
VTATANNGYTFTNWTEGTNVVSTNANYSFTVTGNRNLVANFTAQTYTINAVANPNYGGTVSGGGNFNYGQSCTLTATPAANYTFINWTKQGQVVSTNASYTFTVTESATYQAQFELQSFTITVENANPDWGSVSGGGTFFYGETTEIAATPNIGYVFLMWDDGNTDNPRSIVVTENRTYIGNFAVQQCHIAAEVDPEEAGTAFGGGLWYYGDTISVTVNRNEDWAFVNWTENGEVVSEEMTYTFIATGDRNLVAHFQYTEGIGEGNINAKVYPNPTNGEVTLEAEGLSHIRIVNAFGQTVYNAKVEGEQVRIDLSSMAKGIYMMHIEANGGLEIRKIVVE